MKAAKEKAAQATARTVKPKRATRPKRTHRTPVVRVVAPPEQAGQVGDAPVAALPEPTPTASSRGPPRPRRSGGAGGGSAKPSPPDPIYWVGEG